MRNRNSKDLTNWEQAFVKLNDKLGNEVWGIRQEHDGSGKERLRIFINDSSWKAKVLKATKGTLCGYPLVFTVYGQQDHALSEARRASKEDLLKKENQDAETETTTCRTDGDVQRNSG